MSDNPLAQLQQAAEAVRQQLQLNAYDEAAVQRLADFIEEQRPQLTPETRQGVVVALGAFLGECMVRTFGGEWATGPDGTTGIGIRGDLFFNPFYRVMQQLELGMGEAVSEFFRALPARLAEPPRKKGWI